MRQRETPDFSLIITRIAGYWYSTATWKKHTGISWERCRAEGKTKKEMFKSLRLEMVLSKNPAAWKAHQRLHGSKE